MLIKTDTVSQVKAGIGYLTDRVLVLEKQVKRLQKKKHAKRKR